MTSASIRSKTSGFLKLPIPDVDQVQIEDVAYALSNICRCNGHTTPFFSVLQHSMEVADLCRARANDLDADPDAAELAGLVHDAPEYAVGDVISPLKRRLGSAFADVYREVESNVYSALGVVQVAKLCREIVAWADNQMLLSDMVRWRVYGKIVNSRGEVYGVEENTPLPDGFSVYFPDAVPYAAGCAVARRNFVDRFYRLKEKVCLRHPS